MRGGPRLPGAPLIDPRRVRGTPGETRAWLPPGVLSHPPVALPVALSVLCGECVRRSGARIEPGGRLPEPPGSHSLPTGGTLSRPGLQFFRKGVSDNCDPFPYPLRCQMASRLTDASGKLPIQTPSQVSDRPHRRACQLQGRVSLQALLSS